jgi:autotransporter translocation and assembly factor TamB
LGNRFDIQTGVITLPPDEATVDPYLNVVATTDTDEGMVTATVRGRASKPALDLSSDPRMRESEIFTLLVTGSSQADSGDGEVEAKAANLLATFQNPALRRQLKDKVGIDRAAIGFGESIEQPILTVGKRISKKVMVATSYHHNAPEDENDAEMRVEYRFARKWVAETFFGNAGEGGVNVYWRTFFGKNRPAKSRARPRKGRNDGDGKDFAAKRKPASAR